MNFWDGTVTVNSAARLVETSFDFVAILRAGWACRSGVASKLFFRYQSVLDYFLLFLFLGLLKLFSALP